MTQLAMHEDPRWQVLDEQQRRTLNEIYEAHVVPALEEVAQANRLADSRVMEAQRDADDARRRLRELQDRVTPPDELAAATRAIVEVTAGGIPFGKPSKRNATKVSAQLVAQVALTAAAEVRALQG